jgi:hypothetical protein
MLEKRNILYDEFASQFISWTSYATILLGSLFRGTYQGEEGDKGKMVPYYVKASFRKLSKIGGGMTDSHISKYVTFFPK